MVTRNLTGDSTAAVFGVEDAWTTVELHLVGSTAAEWRFEVYVDGEISTDFQIPAHLVGRPEAVAHANECGCKDRGVLFSLGCLIEEMVAEARDAAAQQAAKEAA